MINYDSILSAFDGKPTLLQWLKMVKKALDESILKSVDIRQNSEKVVFTFNFEDGTSISTPEVTLPKGDKGDTGATGPKGDAGVSITGINTVSDQVVGDETLTTVRAHYSNGANDDFVVKAKNGSTGSTGHIYLHSVKISDQNRTIYFNIYSRKESLTIDDVFEQIPENNYIPMCLYGGSSYGVLTATKKLISNEYAIHLKGLHVNSGSTVNSEFNIYKKNAEIIDTLLGDNL